MVRVLFVCTGNHCRSPMAEGWFRHHCRERGLKGVRVASAGTSALVGEPANPHAVAALAAAGVSLDRFRGRQLTPALVDASTLVVTMADRHRRWTVALCPHAAPKILCLNHCLGRDGEVADPFGGDLADFLACLDSMKPALVALANQIPTLLSPKETTIDESA